MKVAIIGMGVIGKAQARMLAGHDLVTYDIADGETYPANAIAACDFAVVCVGTPAAEDGSAVTHYVREAVSALPGRLPVLLRSTVPPGTTDSLQAARTGFVCHAPEFLHERPGGAWRDSTDVPWMLLGSTTEAACFFLLHLSAVFPGDFRLCTALEAELAKYAANLYWAARVTFVNEMGEICKAFGADWDGVRAAWLQDPRMTRAYTAWPGDEPGFGGRCWPKDLSALIAASEDAGYKAAFLKAIGDANERFRT